MITKIERKPNSSTLVLHFDDGRGEAYNDSYKILNARTSRAQEMIRGYDWAVENYPTRVNVQDAYVRPSGAKISADNAINSDMWLCDGYDKIITGTNSSSFSAAFKAKVGKYECLLYFTSATNYIICLETPTWPEDALLKTLEVSGFKFKQLF